MTLLPVTPECALAFPKELQTKVHLELAQRTIHKRTQAVTFFDTTTNAGPTLVNKRSKELRRHALNRSTWVGHNWKTSSCIREKLHRNKCGSILGTAQGWLGFLGLWSGCFGPNPRGQEHLFLKLRSQSCALEQHKMELTSFRAGLNPSAHLRPSTDCCKNPLEIRRSTCASRPSLRELAVSILLTLLRARSERPPLTTQLPSKWFGVVWWMEGFLCKDQGFKLSKPPIQTPR